MMVLALNLATEVGVVAAGLFLSENQRPNYQKRCL